MRSFDSTLLLLALVAAPLLSACSSSGGDADADATADGAVENDALTSNSSDPRFVPRIAELISDDAKALPLRACAGKIDGAWCGSLLGGDAPPDALVFCGRGKAWDVVTCACDTKAPIKARTASGHAVDMRADECVRRPGSATATRSIIVSERDQVLRACEGRTQFAQFPVSTGAPTYETREPLGMPASMPQVTDFFIADKWMLKRMTSPFASASYDLRIPFAQNLSYHAPDGRTLRSLLYLHAWTDPRTGKDCPKCGVPNDPGPAGGRVYGFSYGCVNETLDAARRLYMWAPAGTPVRVIGGSLPDDGSCGVEPR